MKSNFLKSVIVGFACLTLASGCKMMEKHSFRSHKCSGSSNHKECESKKAEKKAAKKESMKKESVVKTEESKK